MGDVPVARAAQVGTRQQSAFQDFRKFVLHVFSKLLFVVNFHPAYYQDPLPCFVPYLCQFFQLLFKPQSGAYCLSVRLHGHGQGNY